MCSGTLDSSRRTVGAILCSPLMCQRCFGQRDEYSVMPLAMRWRDERESQSESEGDGDGEGERDTESGSESRSESESGAKMGNPVRETSSSHSAGR